MNKYVKPVVLANEEMAEGVYAASGCWTATWNSHQTKDTGRGSFIFQIDGAHIAEAHNPNTIITCTFSLPVKVCQVSYSPVDNASYSTYKTTHQFVRTQPINPNENLGFGNVEVVVEDANVTELELISVVVTDNGAL